MILWPEMFMSQYAQEFQQALRKYNDMFDVFYCRDDSKAKLYFNTKQMPRELPALYIIDPKSQVELRSKEGIPSDGSNNFYFKKYQGFIFTIASPQGELCEFIEKFLDDKHPHHYISEERS